MTKRRAMRDVGHADNQVTLVIPGRDCAATLAQCLTAVEPLRAAGQLAEIIFVDDGSRDATATVAARHAVRVLRGSGRGAGAARNLGWRAATTPWIWFVDADCAAEADALTRLLDHIAQSDAPQRIGAVGGSYGNLRADSLVATLIHEEIVARHARMPADVDFLATFNVLYRRDALVEVGGFDERFLKGQDAELAWRVRRAGWRLRFEATSRVGHHHADRVLPYLRVQARQGYWRAWLYATYPEHLGGDSYSGHLDHVQPVLAMAMLGGLPLLATPPGALAEGALALSLCACQVPMTAKLIERTRDARMLAYAPMGVARAFARGLGLAGGVAAVARRRVAAVLAERRRG